MYNNIYIGTFGELHPDVIENYNLGQRVYVAEINIDTVFENLNLTKSYNPLPKYPSTSRDIALIVKDEVFVKQIEDIIKANGEDLVESYKLFDVYKGAQIEEGHKSIAYSITYRSKDKTLTYITNGEHIILSGNSLELERKKEISEYIKLFLRGGKKWKKNKKEKI